MINAVKTLHPFESEWIERVLFESGEDTVSDRLVELSSISACVRSRDTLEDIIGITRQYSVKINNQLSVFDLGTPDPEQGRFVAVGNYRMRGDNDDLSLMSVIPNSVQRKQVIDDYALARTLDAPLYAKVNASMGGSYWSYDRILVPLRTKELNLLVSAYWHHSEFPAE
jgi:hypothetical protein